jgi:hypothetical protein
MMSFKFSTLCELLDALEAPFLKITIGNPQGAVDTGVIVCERLDKYSHKIPCQGHEAVIFLSCLFLERWADRIYDPKENRLEDIVRIAMGTWPSEQEVTAKTPLTLDMLCKSTLTSCKATDVLGTN